MEDMRKWEDMPTDCLVNIFWKVHLESRLLDIPLVCKSWHQAVRDCWQRLVFPASIWGLSRFHTTFLQNYAFKDDIQVLHKLVTFTVNLNQECAISLWLPDSDDCTREELIYVIEQCPALKVLVLPESLYNENSDIIPGLIVKLKNLEFLAVGCFHPLRLCQCFRMITNMLLPNFSGLCVKHPKLRGKSEACFTKDMFTSIGVEISEEKLLFQMQSCKELLYLNARSCHGFDEGIEEFLIWFKRIR